MEKYTLTLRVPDTDYFEVKIAAESNNGDYIQEIEEYSQSEFDEIVGDLVDLLENYEGHWELEEYNDSGKLKLPYSNGRICSTLDSIKVIKYTTDGKNYYVNIL